MNDPMIKGQSINSLDKVYSLQEIEQQGTPIEDLGMGDYFALMIEKMKNIDPLNVKQDESYIADLASFSHLHNSKEIIRQLENISDQIGKGNTGAGESMNSNQIVELRSIKEELSRLRSDLNEVIRGNSSGDMCPAWNLNADLVGRI